MKQFCEVKRACNFSSICQGISDRLEQPVGLILLGIENSQEMSAYYHLIMELSLKTGQQMAVYFPEDSPSLPDLKSSFAWHPFVLRILGEEASLDASRRTALIHDLTQAGAKSVVMFYVECAPPPILSAFDLPRRYAFYRRQRQFRQNLPTSEGLSYLVKLFP